MAHKIIIMDYSTCEVHIYNYDETEWEDGETFLINHYSDQGQTFRLGQCSWMLVDLEKFEERLPIYIH